MPFTEYIAPIFRAAMEGLRDEERPLRPAEVQRAVAVRVVIDPKHENPADDQISWYSELRSCAEQAALVGWMTTAFLEIYRHAERHAGFAITTTATASTPPSRLNDLLAAGSDRS
ncbi:hypothetical protein OHR68_36205 [Spirillospora sp. NBC_00431]